MKRSGMNMERVKLQNRSLILKYINDHGAVSRKEIARATGLTPASITQITMQLLSENLLIELGTAPDSSGKAGRKEILLDIFADAHWILSLNIEPEETTAAVCNMKGEAVPGKTGEPLITRFPTEKDISPKEFLIRTANRLKKLFFGAAEALGKQIDGVSVGIPASWTPKTESRSTHTASGKKRPTSGRSWRTS